MTDHTFQTSDEANAYTKSMDSYQSERGRVDGPSFDAGWFAARDYFDKSESPTNVKRQVEIAMQEGVIDWDKEHGREVEKLRSQLEALHRDFADVEALRLHTERSLNEKLTQARIAHESDERILAWNRLLSHPALAKAYSHDGSLIKGLEFRLTELAEIEKTVNELKRSDEDTTLAERCQRSEQELREIAISFAVHGPLDIVATARSFFAFFQEGERTSQETRIRAASLSGGVPSKARSIYEYLSGGTS